MAKRILITSTDLMMIQFLAPHVCNFAEHGYEIEIACSNVGNQIEAVRNRLKKYVKSVYAVRFVRSPLSLTNIKGYRDIKRIVNRGHYDIIWTNEPVMGALTRMAARRARKSGTKIVYMVHGFHFYKGAPLINWMLFYPAERLLSLLTDYIITVNKEDYIRAEKFPVKGVDYIHGIGADTERLQSKSINENIRKKLAIPEDAFLVLSVGELNANKNQKVIIDALAILKDKDIYYVLCGSGKNRRKLWLRARKDGIESNVRFVEYRRDVINFYDQADVFVLPSFREGLPIALLEAMYCGVAPVTSDIRGVRDIMKNEITGIVCNPADSSAFAEAIKILKDNSQLRAKYGSNSKRSVEPFMLSLIKDKILNVFNQISCEDEGCR